MTTLAAPIVTTLTTLIVGLAIMPTITTLPSSLPLMSRAIASCTPHRTSGHVPVHVRVMGCRLVEWDVLRVRRAWVPGCAVVLPPRTAATSAVCGNSAAPPYHLVYAQRPYMLSWCMRSALTCYMPSGRCAALC